jgi:hypothetical protein
MSVFGGPKILNDELIFSYDMGSSKKSWIGRPTTNVINAATAALSRYNNPGFSGTATNTGLTYKGMPIYELTFIPQDSTFIPRLASTEGFGCFHTMGIALQANTRYMASIYVRSDHPLQVSATQGYNNTYSNISGWGQNSTSTTRYQEDGWTRLYSQYLNNVDGYSVRTSAFQVNFTVNTTSTETVDVNFTVLANGSGISDFTTLHAIGSASPTIVNNGGLTGLSIVNHGLDTTNFQRLSWPSVIKLKSTDLPFNYFVRLSVPSTGGVNTTIALRANFVGYYTALTDNKFWKVTFDTTNVSTSQVLKTYWCCPMIEQHTTVYPSTFVNGTRSTTQAILDLKNNTTITTNTDVSYRNDGTFEFLPSNSNSTLSIPLSTSLNKLTGTISAWVYPRGYSGSNGIFVNRENSTSNALDWLWIGSWSSGSIFYFRLGNGSDCCSQDLTISSWSTVCPVNTWSNVTVTWQSGSFSRIYVNGNLIASRTITSIPNTNPSTTGRVGLGHASGDTGSWNGAIANFSIFNRALSDSEVRENFNALRGRFGI